MAQPQLEITMVGVDELVPYANNAKIHTEAQIEHICNSIKAFGFNDPIGIWHNEAGVPEVVTGHGALKAAKKMGIEQVPCTYLDHLTDEERREYCHVHNQTQLETSFDYDALVADMDNLNADWESFGFEAFTFDPETYCKDADEEAEYNAFVDKFKPKKTTDDCYTTDDVYEAVRSWVASEYGIEGREVVRPFYPGGDYERFEYPDGCVVIDNPPFSILSEILRFYNARGIDYFLFAPALTSLKSNAPCHVYISSDITYENGANVKTCFLTDMEDNIARTAPSLSAAIEKVQESPGGGAGHLRVPRQRSDRQRHDENLPRRD